MIHNDEQNKERREKVKFIADLLLEDEFTTVDEIGDELFKKEKGRLPKNPAFYNDPIIKKALKLDEINRRNETRQLLVHVKKYIRENTNYIVINRKGQGYAVTTHDKFIEIENLKNIRRLKGFVGTIRENLKSMLKMGLDNSEHYNDFECFVDEAETLIRRVYPTVDIPLEDMEIVEEGGYEGTEETGDYLVKDFVDNKVNAVCDRYLYE